MNAVCKAGWSGKKTKVICGVILRVQKLSCGIQGHWSSFKTGGTPSLHSVPSSCMVAAICWAAGPLQRVLDTPIFLGCAHTFLPCPYPSLPLCHPLPALDSLHLWMLPEILDKDPLGIHWESIELVSHYSAGDLILQTCYSFQTDFDLVQSKLLQNGKPFLFPFWRPAPGTIQKEPWSLATVSQRKACRACHLVAASGSTPSLTRQHRCSSPRCESL